MRELWSVICQCWCWQYSEVLVFWCGLFSCCHVVFGDLVSLHFITPHKSFCHLGVQNSASVLLGMIWTSGKVRNWSCCKKTLKRLRLWRGWLTNKHPNSVRNKAIVVSCSGCLGLNVSIFLCPEMMRAIQNDFFFKVSDFPSWNFAW